MGILRLIHLIILLFRKMLCFSRLRYSPTVEPPRASRDVEGFLDVVGSTSFSSSELSTSKDSPLESGVVVDPDESGDLIMIPFSWSITRPSLVPSMVLATALETSLDVSGTAVEEQSSSSSRSPSLPRERSSASWSLSASAIYRVRWSKVFVNRFVFVLDHVFTRWARYSIWK